jgi:hypothetical protein
LTIKGNKGRKQSQRERKRERGRERGRWRKERRINAELKDRLLQKIYRIDNCRLQSN